MSGSGFSQASATQAARNAGLQRISFWTTPGAHEQIAAYPFTTEDFLPPP
jgi:hypothetical protein